MYAYHPHYVDAVANRMRPSDAHIYLSDANFNVTALMTAAGSVVERYDYTPYGESVVSDANFAVDSDGKSDVAMRSFIRVDGLTPTPACSSTATVGITSSWDGG